MRIFHFCNDTFGAPFAAFSAGFSMRERVPIVLVYSVRSQSPKQRIARALRGVAGRLKNPYLSRLYLENVNGEDFRRHIEPGDAGVVTGFGQIFKTPTIERFSSLANLHPSILPHYRGPAPTHWCVERGETQTGFTLHQITARIDDGPVLHQELVEIDAGDTRDTLARKIGVRALPVFERYLHSLVERRTWERVSVDADAVYRTPLGYAPSPP